MSDAREMFENWASAPPREFDIERLDEEDYSWPGSYRVYKVQCMWEAWCEQEENIKRRTAKLEADIKELQKKTQQRKTRIHKDDYFDLAIDTDSELHLSILVKLLDRRDISEAIEYSDDLVRRYMSKHHAHE